MRTSEQKLGPLTSRPRVAPVTEAPPRAAIASAMGTALPERLRGAATGTDVGWRQEELLDGHAERWRQRGRPAEQDGYR